MLSGTELSTHPHRTGRISTSATFTQDSPLSQFSARCAAREPGFECVSVRVAGYRSCPAGHALVPMQRSAAAVSASRELELMSTSPEDSR